MNTDTIRLNVTLPKDLAMTLDKLSGRRKRSRFIAEAVKKMIEFKEKENLDRLLVEGYQAARQENQALAKEFEASDLEGWDEY